MPRISAKERNSLLWEAIYHEDYPKLLKAIKVGADPNYQNDVMPFTPLCDVIRRWHRPLTTPHPSRSEVMRSLIEHGADVNSTTCSINAFTEAWQLIPLHCAIYHQANDAAKILLDAKANPNIADRNGNVPLHLVVGMPDNEAVRPLVIGELKEIERWPEWTQNDKKKLIAMLLEHGADPTIPNKNGVSALELARRRKDHVALTMMQDMAEHSHGAHVRRRH
jgi:ankyrin repeat protein